jgi:hypothetical protein
MRRHLHPVGFDYLTDRRGLFAPLQDGLGHQVILCEYPQSLLTMHRLKLLVGEALRDAVRLSEA